VRSMGLVVPSRDTIAVYTPPRPSIAVAVAFPGSIMASGLGREERKRLSKPLSHGAE
jgi:hypothetical protein